MAATLNPLRYRGYVYDQETNLYYLQSRYYNPKTGRFLNADAYASTGQGFLGHNMFAYCGNNPVNYIDSNGEFALLAAFAVATVIAGVANAISTAVTGGSVDTGVDMLETKLYSTQEPTTSVNNVGKYGGGVSLGRFQHKTFVALIR